MEENNNFNNENNSIVNTVEKKPNANTTIIAITIIVLVVVGVASYFLFIKGKENDGPTNTPTPTLAPNKDESTPTPVPQNSENTNKLAENMVFKSKDGKDTFTITKMEEKGEEGWYAVHVDYNGKKYTFNIEEDSYKYGKFVRLEGDADSYPSGQCYSTGGLLNLDTKTIERIKSTNMPFYDVIEGNDGYFFTEGYCLCGFDIVVYDNNWNKLGNLVGSTDEQGNIYAVSDGKIAKYNASGEKIDEVSTTARYIGPGLINNNTLYYLGEEEAGAYLYVNGSTDKYRICDEDANNKEGEYPYKGLDIDAYYGITLSDNKLLIKYKNTEYEYSLDLNTKQFTKIDE